MSASCARMNGHLFAHYLRAIDRTTRHRAAPPSRPEPAIRRRPARRRRRMAVTLLVAALVAALVVALGFGSDGRAGAAVVGCAPSVGGRTFDIFGEITVTTEWSLGSDSGTNTTVHGFPAALTDVNGDGVVNLGDYDGGDGSFDFDGDGIGELRVADSIDTDGNGAIDVAIATDLVTLGQAVTGGYQHNAVATMIEKNYGYHTLVDGYGLDYADHAVVPTAPSPANFLPLEIDATLFDVTQGHVLPAGRITISYTLPFSDGTTDTYTASVDTSGADVTGAAGATSVWPLITRASLFVDGALFDTLVVGLATTDFFGNPVPASDVALEVVIDNVAGVDKDNHIAVAARGALTTDAAGVATGVGVPGRLGGAIVKECAALPYTTWLGISHDGADLGSVGPEALDVDLSIYSGDTNGDGILDPATERTLYVDATITDPPSLMHATMGQDDVDVDGDGTTDGLDINNDGAIDELPLEYVGFEHNGSTAPDLEAVVATRPKANAASGAPLYLAARVEDLPAAVTFERGGEPTGIDADGDLAYDDIDLDGDVDGDDAVRNDRIGSLAFCEKDFSTYPAACVAPAAASGLTDIAYLEDIPTPDLTTGALPIELGATFPRAGTTS